MAVKQLPTWIAVMDGAQARFFALRQGEGGQIFEEAAPALNADPKPDRGGKPGRGFATGKARGVVEPRGNLRKIEKRDFIHLVADALNAAAEQRVFGRLVLASPPRSLGELREALSERALSCLSHEIPKTLTNLPPDVLWKKLSKLLLTAARPLGAKKADGKAPPAVPVLVTFRSTEASAAVQAEALRYAAKLSRKFARIEGCKIMIEAPRRKSPKGKLFDVSLDVTVPGRTITVKSSGAGMHTHENAHMALRDAFDAAERQLRDITGHDNAGSRRGSAPRSRMLEDVD
jgi:protein required for attachment to host cells